MVTQVSKRKPLRFHYSTLISPCSGLKGELEDFQFCRFKIKGYIPLTLDFPQAGARGLLNTGAIRGDRSKDKRASRMRLLCHKGRSAFP